MDEQKPQATSEGGIGQSASTGGLGISVTPLDECCFDIKFNDEHIGVWCPASHRVVIDGDVVGFAWSKDEVLAGLELRDVKAWGMRPNVEAQGREAGFSAKRPLERRVGPDGSERN